jgi:hypothetical protein
MEDIKVLFPRQKTVQLLPGAIHTWGHQILYNILTAKGFDADAAQAMLGGDKRIWPKCIWFAGGAALAAVQIDGPVAKKYGDIDVFITREGLEELPSHIAENVKTGLGYIELEQFFDLPRILADDITVDAKKISPQRKYTSKENIEITYVNKRMEPVVTFHITTTTFDNIETVMDRFDLDCCKVAVRPYDGEVRVSKDWKPYNVYRPDLGSDRYIWRLAKYATRGFPVHIQYPNAQNIQLNENVPQNADISFGALTDKSEHPRAVWARAEHHVGKGLGSLLAFAAEPKWNARGVQTAYLQIYERLARKAGGCYSFARLPIDKVHAMYLPATYIPISKMASEPDARVNNPNNVTPPCVPSLATTSNMLSTGTVHKSDTVVAAGCESLQPKRDEKPLSICDDVDACQSSSKDEPVAQVAEPVAILSQASPVVPSESNGYFPFCSFALGCADNESILYCALANPKSLLVKVELTSSQIVFTLSESTHRSWFPENATLLGKEILPTTLRFDWPLAVKSRVSHRLFYRHTVQALNGLVVVGIPLFPENEPETVQISLM